MPGKTLLGRDIVDAMTGIGYRFVKADWDANIIYLQSPTGATLKIEISEAHDRTNSSL